MSEKQKKKGDSLHLLACKAFLGNNERRIMTYHDGYLRLKGLFPDAPIEVELHGHSMVVTVDVTKEHPHVAFEKMVRFYTELLSSPSAPKNDDVTFGMAIDPGSAFTKAVTCGISNSTALEDIRRGLITAVAESGELIKQMIEEGLNGADEPKAESEPQTTKENLPLLSEDHEAVYALLNEDVSRGALFMRGYRELAKLFPGRRLQAEAKGGRVMLMVEIEPRNEEPDWVCDRMTEFYTKLLSSPEAPKNDDVTFGVVFDLGLGESKKIGCGLSNSVPLGHIKGAFSFSMDRALETIEAALREAVGDEDDKSAPTYKVIH